MLSDSFSPTFQTECSKCPFRVEDYFRPPELTAMPSGVHLFHFASVVLGVDSNHATRLVCASRSSYSPPSNFVSGHVSCMCFMVCCWPQSQEGDWARPSLYRFALSQRTLDRCLVLPL